MPFIIRIFYCVLYCYVKQKNTSRLTYAIIFSFYTALCLNIFSWQFFFKIAFNFSEPLEIPSWRLSSLFICVPKPVLPFGYIFSWIFFFFNTAWSWPFICSQQKSPSNLILLTHKRLHIQIFWFSCE